MKKIRKSIAFVLFMVMMLSVLCSAPFSVSATGNTWDPANGHYNISTEADLFAFRDALNSGVTYENIEVNLLNDITVTDGHIYYAPSDQTAEFRGTFKGNKHKISNLNIESSDNESASLFTVLNGATIRDLTLNDIKIENGTDLNSRYVAFLAISAITGDDVEITNCHISGDSLIKCRSDYSGFAIFAGIVAEADGSNLKISDCTTADSVIIGDKSTQVYRESGGLIGYICGSSTSIVNCINRASVDGNYGVAGIAAEIMNRPGSQGSLIIENCINYGDLVANSGDRYPVCRWNDF